MHFKKNKNLQKIEQQIDLYKTLQLQTIQVMKIIEYVWTLNETM